MKNVGSSTLFKVGGGSAGAGGIGLGLWLITNGHIGAGIALAIALTIFGGLVALLGSVVPQNSRDRVEWTRVVLGYLLARRAGPATALINGVPIVAGATGPGSTSLSEGTTPEITDASATTGT